MDQPILDAVAAPARERLGKPVALAVRTLDVRDGWAFLLADMQEPDGRPLDYAGTPMQEAARAGAVSTVCAALLRQGPEGWSVVATAFGPTDVAWEGWSAEYGAPPALFG